VDVDPSGTVCSETVIGLDPKPTRRPHRQRSCHASNPGIPSLGIRRFSTE